MKYIVDTIIKTISSQNPRPNEQLRIRISGFEDVRIYEAVAKRLHDTYDGRLAVETRLSKEKCNEFKKDSQSNQTAMLSLEAHGWVAMKNSLTYYRNLPLSEAQLIVIMGTEAVDDQGGLSDFYYLDPEKLVSELVPNYYLAFSPIAGGWTDDEKKCVNKLYGDLFSLVPINLCKFSDLADSWGTLSTIEDFVERFFEQLPLWGLCRVRDTLPTVNQIIKTGRKNLLQTNYDFITRKLFAKMTIKQFNNYLNKVELYQNGTETNKENTKKYPEDWTGWSNQSVKSLLTYSNSLSQFIRGENIEENRRQLQGVDFAITEYVLGITLPDVVVHKKKKLSVTGDPYFAFLKAICASIACEDTEPFDTIRVKVSSIELADAVDSLIDADESAQLATAWKKVCWFAGGVIEYINSIGFEVNGNEISIESDDSSPFDSKCVELNISEGLISTAAASKKLDKVSFEVAHYHQGKSTDIRHSFEWTFTLHDDWVIAFDQMCLQYEQWDEDQIDAAVPVLTVDKYEALMNAKSEEEFLDVFELSSLSFDLNLSAEAQKQLVPDGTIEWRAEYSALGRSFVSFCRSLTSVGFYADILQNQKGECKANRFIDGYVKLGDLIVNSTFTQKSEWVMDYFTHAFAIESSTRAITTGENDTGCIIPPFHPAILQKMIDRVVFVADGCREWLHDNEEMHASFDKICSMVNELAQLSQIQEGVDIFPSIKGTFFGTTQGFANYCICGECERSSKMRMTALMKKDAVFDDDFSDGALKTMNVSAKMFADVLETYKKALPNYSFNLSIAVINPEDLQPIIAALYQYISTVKKEPGADEKAIQIRLHVLVRPKNKGGKNYLSYWANTFFNQDENVDLKIYLNEWNNNDDLEKLLDTNLDLIFLMDVLVLNQLRFVRQNAESSGSGLSDCRFPIVFKPAPVSVAYVKRSIELTQQQFGAATIHSQVVYYRETYESFPYQKQLVVREASIDKERKDLIVMLHRKSNWVVCVDSGMDGALLRDREGKNQDYSIIGFSTGKGPHGQYNLTITARNSIINAVEAKLKRRLQKSFSWDKLKTTVAARVCMDEARNLDGVSLLSAINPKDENIHEFLAYVLTSLQAKKERSASALQVVVHLDSYQHWFESNILEEKVENRSRPNFLQVSADIGDDGKIHLDATVIECKIAKYDNAEERKADAIQQVKHGIEHLSKLFDPRSTSIRRRYWFAQLYRALAFSQITFQSDTLAFQRLSEQMRDILEGSFEISWFGKIMGYWKDMPGENEIITTMSMVPMIKLHEVPQKRIQRILLDDDDAAVEFVSVVEEDETDIPEEEEDESVSVQAAHETTPAKETAEEVSTDLSATNENSYSGETASTSQEEEKAPVLEPVLDTGKQPTPPSQAKTEKPEVIQKRALEDVRVFIGKDKAGNKVFWDFGHPKLANRHLLITGTSGQGKTYSIQAMLKELAENGISSVIFDYTEGFREDQLEPAFRNALADRISQQVVYVSGIPIDPFRRHEIEIGDFKVPEKVSDVSQRIAAIFTHVYNFGEQQFGAIYSACSDAMNTYGDQTDIFKFREKLKELGNPAAKSVLTKMAPFFDSVEFQKDAEFDWNSVIRSDGSIIIFQLTHYVREIQVIITEMMLWDAWHYFKKNGDKNTPFVVVLDEAQNLSMKDGSPAEVILREGRKFGWSAWFATQSLKSLSENEVVNLRQAPFSLYFKPTDDEILKIAKQIDPTSSNSWVTQIKGLHKGQCVVVGDRVRTDGTFGTFKPTVTNVTSFEEREHEEV